MPSKSFGNSMLSLYCGNSLSPLLIYENLACQHSGFFKARCSFNELIGGSNSCHIADYGPDLMEMYNSYLCTGSVFSRQPSTEGVKPKKITIHGSTMSEDDIEWLLLAELHIMGGFLLDTKFQNIIIDAMFEKLQSDGDAPLILAEGIYSHTPPGDPLRRMLVDLHVYLWHGECIESAGATDAQNEADFMYQVAKELLAVNARGPLKDAAKPWDLDGCRYHIHGSDAEKRSCKSKR
ncbi:hypothetical protein BDZ85DRAFT_263013 [Elsinoe ampelina]|uniref:Uncharacterized protein n=1 Tax=Elsinoe ampelina TaxID=302913 RepID=A0A6A6GBL0_9PEZI|nr:hypothetical protein BDZ85DRAFT_263013 [Elsinoe ampelina]